MPLVPLGKVRPGRRLKEAAEVDVLTAGFTLERYVRDELTNGELTGATPEYLAWLEERSCRR